MYSRAKAPTENSVRVLKIQWTVLYLQQVRDRQFPEASRADVRIGRLCCSTSAIVDKFSKACSETGQIILPKACPCRFNGPFRQQYSLYEALRAREKDRLVDKNYIPHLLLAHPRPWYTITRIVGRLWTESYPASFPSRPPQTGESLLATLSCWLKCSAGRFSQKTSQKLELDQRIITITISAWSFLCQPY